MITEDYVSFKVAKLLKEKGFNESTSMVYMSYGDLCKLDRYDSIRNSNYNDITKNYFEYTAPTLQMTMKWLREEHLLYADFSFNRKDRKYTFNIVQYFNAPEDKSKPYTEQIFHVVYKTCNTYEGACEEAIKYCLENLI